jgi:hypothetical protein
MNIQLTFKNIVDAPMCSIYINNQELYKGTVPPTFDTTVDSDSVECVLTVRHFDKRPEDTMVVDGAIVRDRSFEIEKVIIDNQDLDELIWESEFRAVDGAVYKSCLFFGPNGQFVLKFTNPVLRWILQTRHHKNNNDPYWEEDYNYYQQACKILQQISIK